MAAKVARLRYSYALNSGAEQADCSLYFLSPAGNPLSDLVAAHDGLVDTWWGVWKDYLKTTTTFVRTRADLIDVNSGHVISGTDAAIPLSNAGTSTATQLPLQCAEVLTLRTLFSGASFHGRIYLPPVTITFLTASGFINTSAQTNFVDSTATYLDGVISGGVDWVPGVYSRKNSAVTPITSVEMGTVMDTQRRRRTSLVEARYSADVS